MFSNKLFVSIKFFKMKQKKKFLLFGKESKIFYKIGKIKSLLILK
jgi:hypothetical protein